jgi:creatinine amidohydrolase
MMTMRLQLMAWPEVETYLKRSSGIIIPIGSAEQHGPTGFIGTDALCPEIVADNLAEEVDAIIAPTISVGMAQHHLGFPGSITLRPSTLIAVIGDTVASLARHGFDRFYFVNGHGGNIATVKAAFDEIYAETSLGTARHNRTNLRCVLRNWYDCSSAQEIEAEEFGDANGRHATAGEVSLTYFAYPEDGARIRGTGKLSPEIAPLGTYYDCDDYRRTFPDGRIGSDPTLATADIGSRLRDAAVSDLAADYRRFLDAN